MYSAKSANRGQRLVGRKYKYDLVLWKTNPPKGGQRQRNGQFSRPLQPPFVPSSIAEPLHFGANSLCYCIQLAHIMGARTIYVHAMTLEQKQGYEHGPDHPLIPRHPGYENRHVLAWLRWYAENHPGRVKLVRGWHGPLYDAHLFEEVDLHVEHSESQG